MPTNLKLLWSVTDAYSGQVNECCHAMRDGHEVGRLEIAVFEDTPSIQWIEVYPGALRTGVGSAMVRDLQERFPETEIKWSSTLPDGEALRLSLACRVVVNEAVCSMVREHEQCVANRTVFEAKDAKFSELKNPSPEEAKAHRDWMFEAGPKWNDLHDRIWELERDLRDGPSLEKRLVLGKSDADALKRADDARSVAGSPFRASEVKP